MPCLFRAMMPTPLACTFYRDSLSGAHCVGLASLLRGLKRCEISPYKDYIGYITKLYIAAARFHLT